MNRFPALVATFFLLSTTFPGVSQEAGPATDSGQPKPAADPAKLEEEFKALLTNATLAGRWSSTENGTLGAEREDKYTIVSAAKVRDSSWVVNARLEYRGRAFVLPIPVQVKWAGDTAVLIVDDMGIPGGGNTYSARVMFHGNTYAGSWSGGGSGGLLYGMITNGAAPPAATE
jgi:hypothetical protein